MRILICSYEFPPCIGGAGVVASEYAEALSVAGHEVTVLANHCENRDAFPGFTIISHRSRPKLWVLTVLRAVKFDDYDLIFINDMKAVRCASMFFTRTLLQKSIFMLHGSEPEVMFLKTNWLYSITLQRLFYLRALKHSKRIIAVSEFMKAKFLKYSGQYVLSEKIDIIHNFIDLEIFRPAKNYKADLKDQLSIRQESFIFVSASRIVFEKGYLEKLDIFERIVSREQREHHWLIIGDGKDKKELLKEVEKRGLGERVRFLGSVSRPELMKFYAGADVFWQLSNYEEAFGLVYLEAQACGCPVIAKNIGGVSEAMVDGETGFLVRNGLQVQNIINNNKISSISAKKMVEFASNFSSGELVAFVAKFATDDK